MKSAPPTRYKAPMDSLRKTALAAGVLYVITFISMPSFWLYASVKELGYIAGPGPDTRAISAASSR